MSKDRLDDMKQEYESYQVPAEAYEYVQKGIQRANRERRFRQLLKTTGTTVAAASLGLVVLVNSSADIARAMERIPVIGTIAEVVTFRDYSNKNGNFEADVKVPQISGSNEDASKKLLGANRSIQEYADQLIQMYENDLKASEGEGNYELKSSYEVICDSDDLLSIRINSCVVMAGGNEFVKIFNIEKSTGALLTLTDLLKDDPEAIEKINQNILAQMQAQMDSDETLTYFIYSEEEPYGFQSVSEDTDFYLDDDGALVIVFDEYEVAPGYMGVVEFTIPQDIVSAASAR